MSPTLPLPPPRLRARVSGIDDTDLFLRVGKNSIDDMRRSLGEISRSFGSFGRILDIGCGCGRTIRWFDPPVAELYGCDIDEEAILWCQDNLSFARFLRNAMRPPLPYQDGQFDLVYSISIFTHLREDYQRLWFAECARIIAPGGIFLFTINDRGSWPPDSVDEIRANGIKFFPPGDNEFWPDWYGTAYLDLDKLGNFMGQNFEFRYHAAKGLNGHQDIVIARRL
jgi:SAM-dependent methyltransferase